jgi:hypothetical protein
VTERTWLDPHRRALQIGLGVIWLLDAALQLQPYMFSKAFPQQALAPAGAGSPSWIAHPVHWAAQLTAGHVVIFNAIFATVQLLIALGLFNRPTVRIALLGSIGWSLGVWWMGEGLGGLFAGPQTVVMGAPGAAALYAVISILIWPKDRPSVWSAHGTGSVATTSPLRGIAPRLLWLGLWGGFAIEALQGGNRAPSALHDAIAGMADGEPVWLSAINRQVAGALAHHGTEVSVALAIGCGLIAVSVCAGTRMARTGLVLAMVLAAVIWVVAQDLGEIATGAATDPNTGPLLILLAATYWPFSRAEPQRGPSSIPSYEATAELLTVGGRLNAS